MRTLATVLEEGHVVCDLIRGIQEYVHVDVCQLVERLVIKDYPVKFPENATNPTYMGKQLVPSCFLFHPVWNEWVFAATTGDSDVLATCSSLESRTCTVNWLAGKVFTNYEYDADEYDDEQDGIERQVEYVRETDRCHVIQFLLNIRGMMIDVPTGELLIFDDTHI